MTETFAMSTVIRPHIAARIIGGKFCLLNQNRGEAWICRGSSRQIWERLQQGRAVPEVAQELAQVTEATRPLRLATFIATGICSSCITAGGFCLPRPGCS